MPVKGMRVKYFPHTVVRTVVPQMIMNKDENEMAQEQTAWTWMRLRV